MAKITLDEAKKEAASLRTQLDEWADAYYSKDKPSIFNSTLYSTG